MIRSIRFVVVNVFAETHFGGNPLAVFPDARGLSTETMQLIARQFNLAETTFVLPPRDAGHTASVRIFTPLAELPFAGHPTVGTASVLARSGKGAGTLVLEEGLGPVPVEVHFDGDRTFATLNLASQIERADGSLGAGALAQVLSLDAQDLVESWFASAGVRFCFARLASPAAVDRAALNHAAWTTTLRDAWSPHIFFFSGNPRAEKIYARMFAPALGIAEDPASGAAAVALVGSLAERWFNREGSLSIDIDQGVSMGRPSVLTAIAKVADGRANAVALRGQAIVIAEGEMRAPVAACA